MRDRKSIAELADELEHQGDELAAMPGAPAPTAVHLAAVNVMSDLMSLGRRFMATPEGRSNTPAYFSAMMAMLDRGRAIMLEEIARVPPDSIKQFMSDLAARIQTIVDTPLDDDSTEAVAGGDSDSATPATDQPRADQPAAS